MKQRKIAISLAVVGAIAAPFVFEPYKAEPEGTIWEPLTVEDKDEMGAFVKSTNNCQTFPDGVTASPTAVQGCRYWQKALEEGGRYGPGPSAPLYLALNAAVAVVAFAVIFALTYLLPALARRYWRWLNT
jgi:hypothetical protein